MAKKKIKLHAESTHKWSESADQMVQAVMSDISQGSVQYTDTSYTSASFESLSSLMLLSETSLGRKNRKRKKLDSVRNISTHRNDKSIKSTSNEEHVSYEGVKKKKKGKGRGKKKEEQREEEFPFEKPKKWEKMNKKEQDDWVADQILMRKLELEEKKLEIKERRKQKAKARLELIADEANKNDVRRDILAKTCLLFKKHEKLKQDRDAQDLTAADWKSYLHCDKLTSYPPQLNLYLSRWRANEYHDYTDDELCRRFHEVIRTVDYIKMMLYMDKSKSPEVVKNINQCCMDLRSELVKAFEYTTFNILRDICKNMHEVTTKEATYYKWIEGVQLHIYVAIKQPTRRMRPDELIPQCAIWDFPHLDLHVNTPPIINMNGIVVRVARNPSDLLSPICQAFELAHDMPLANEDLYTSSLKEFDYVQRIRNENDEITINFYKTTRERIKELEKIIKQSVFAKLDEEKAELERLQFAEPPALLGGRNPRERICVENETELNMYLLSNIPVITAGELNLRKYRICGGVLNIDLFEVPPQSKYVRHGIHLRILSLPKLLKDVWYRVNYQPTLEIEEQEKNTPEARKNMEAQGSAERDKLVIVRMKVPENVICLESPVVCQWNGKAFWSTDSIFEQEFDCLNSSLQFRTSQLLPFGIAILKYSNMPYRTWELRRNSRGKGVLFTVQGLYITVTINCRNRCVMLKEVTLENSCKQFTYFEQFFDKAMSVHAMKQIFQDAGCDLFPDFDGHNYIKGTCIKKWVLEKHLYHAMAFLAKGYGFKHSRWNHVTGCRNIVCQIREEVYPKREVILEDPYKLLYATPESCTILKRNEDMEEFDTTPVMGLDFQPDLFALNMAYGSLEARRRAFSVGYQLTETIFELLKEVKPCSFA